MEPSPRPPLLCEASEDRAMTIHVRNGRVDIDVPSDDNARQCARLLKEHPSSIKSIDLSKGVMTSAGAGVIAKALKGERREA